MQNSKAKVYAPFELEPSEQKTVAKAIAKKLGGVKCEFLVDEKIKGGIKITYGSQVLDLTLEGALDALRRAENYEE